jgi:8-amino-7-oxononanoate synthase
LSLFDKCAAFFEESGDYARAVKADLYPYFRPIERNEGTRAIMNGAEVIMAGSNNYLGLVSDPRVKEAAMNAVNRYGTGCTGSRFLNGTLDLHIQLEEMLARFMGTEACVLFSTGYMTNQGVVQALAGRGDIVFSDKENHACIDLRVLLEKATAERPGAGRLIVSDGVFSMSGAIAQVPDLVALAREYDAALMLDDAHAVGVIGPGGRGSAASFGLSDQVELTTGTFSKSFASLGGFCVGSEETVDYIRHHSSTHIFSASMPPANVATVIKCLEILEQEPERLDRLWAISDFMRDGFRQAGFNVLKSQAPIIPVVVGDLNTCLQFWKELINEGVFVNAVAPPAVPRGQCLMRTSYMATHSDSELDQILTAFQKVGQRLGVIGSNGSH